MKAFIKVEILEFNEDTELFTLGVPVIETHEPEFETNMINDQFDIDDFTIDATFFMVLVNQFDIDPPDMVGSVYRIPTGAL